VVVVVVVLLLLLLLLLLENMRHPACDKSLIFHLQI
jgi:hypothetical protein